MADFIHPGWGTYITVITILGIVACAVLLWVLSSQRQSGGAPGQTTETTGHVWDEDLGEYNNPLPRWWMYLFYITIVFAIGYLALYPGLGSNAGIYQWTQRGQYEAEMARAKAQYEPLFNRYLAMELPQVAIDPQAKAIGERLFLNNCAQCHGSDARGNKGFPNLTDKDWLWGGDPANIQQTILEGRRGVMPSMAAAVGSEEDQKNVAHYVLSLSGAPHESSRVEAGKAKFTVCAACHGLDGQGNTAIGAPNLTDKIWLHGSGEGAILQSIRHGWDNQMPAFKDSLGEAKVHLLAAYIWGLSNQSDKAASNTVSISSGSR